MEPGLRRILKHNFKIKKKDRIKEIANFLFARMPKLYAILLKLRKNYNREKVLFLQLVKDGDVVCDIGANKGYYTLLFSHIVGKNGKVHAFEPGPQAFKDLSYLLSEKKRYKNVYLNNDAVGDINGRVTLHVPDNDDGQASITAHSCGSWKGVKQITDYDCNIIRLDDYAEDKIRQRLNFIKCDVEGAELLVLKGAEETIAKYSPIIYLEVYYRWTKDFGYYPADIVKFLKSYNYSSFYLIDKYVYKLNHPEIELSPDQFSRSANLVCTVPSIHDMKICKLLKHQ